VAARLQLILFAIVAALALVDATWVNAGHFDVDAKAYGGIALLTVLFAAGGVYYDRVRKEERLAAMLVGTSFLLGMSAGFSLLNYLLLTVAGHRIDVPLAALDRAIGVDWPAMMVLVSQHPLLAAVMQVAYISVLPQLAVLVAVLGWLGKHERIYSLCLALTAGAAISMSVWTLAPSFGAFSVYDLPAGVSHHLPLALDGHYAKALVALLAHGPGHISPTDAKGLIGFPSFHAVMALFVVWHARELAVVRWFALTLNSIVLIATPIQGGHHVVDVIAGFAVAALAILFASRVVRQAARAHDEITIEAQPAGI
jgi:membrane-associated phospholipid phosphatase